MAVALREIITERVLTRPSILEATRVCGLTDSEVARLLGITPMQVNDWAKGRRPIPKVKFVSLWLIVHTLRGMIGKAPPESPQTTRAHLLHDAVGKFADLAMAETFSDGVPEDVLWLANDLANRALEKLGGGYVIPDE